MMDFDFDPSEFDQIADMVSGELGESIKETRIYLLGHPGRLSEKDAIRAALGTDTDVPGMVWIHPLSTRIPGQAPDTSEEPPRMALNIGIGKIRDDELIYGLPVYVKKDGRYDTLYGMAGYLAAEYLHNVKVRPHQPVEIGQFEYMLIRPTIPASDCVIFTGGYPVLIQQIYQLLPRQTLSLIGAYGGDELATGQAIAVQVSVDAATDTLYFNAGSPFTFNPNTGLPDHRTAFEDYYPQTLVGSRFLLGWVRIHKTMTIIDQTDILAAQEIVGKAGTGSGASGDPVTYCGRGIWYNGEQVFYDPGA